MSRELIDRYETEDGDITSLRCSVWPTRAHVKQWVINEWGLSEEDAEDIASEARIIGMRLRDVLGCAEYRVTPTECCCPDIVRAFAPGSELYWDVRA